MDEEYITKTLAKGPHDLLRYLFFLILVRPLMLIIMGMNVRNADRLPDTGPAVVVANHNSHLDTLAVMTLIGMHRLHLVRPVAAADYFLKTKWRAWFSIRILGIIPLDRGAKQGDKTSGAKRGERTHPLAPIEAALDANEIVLLFPEGTRGSPEQTQPLQPGIAHLAKRRPHVSLTPLFMHGLGKALPRGEGLLVPFICDIYVGDAVHWPGDKKALMQELQSAMDSLERDSHRPEFIC
ncbi:lysophospholipid acyltransferase family protein [Neorhodopirellula lusitana]|uniref:lysophospholipid acyltransferase family protein n=1 Tax=Neorhodopirellula lusitana TaxID=445327 RepID=UPI00384B3074